MSWESEFNNTIRRALINGLIEKASPSTLRLPEKSFQSTKLIMPLPCSKPGTVSPWPAG